MEWAIPIQAFEPKHVAVGSLQTATKQLVPLSYQDGPYRFSSLNLLLPTLDIKSYDSSTGRLVLSMVGNTMTQTKISYFQDLLFSSIARMQDQWFPSEPKKELKEIRKGFQPFLDNASLYLYCPVGSHLGSDIHYYSKGAWSHGFPADGGSGQEFFEVGRPIRIAIRIYGLSFHQHPITSMWTGKFRLQHKVLAIYAD